MDDGSSLGGVDNAGCHQRSRMRAPCVHHATVCEATPAGFVTVQLNHEKSWSAMAMGSAAHVHHNALVSPPEVWDAEGRTRRDPLVGLLRCWGRGPSSFGSGPGDAGGQATDEESLNQKLKPNGRQESRAVDSPAGKLLGQQIHLRKMQRARAAGFIQPTKIVGGGGWISSP